MSGKVSLHPLAALAATPFRLCRSWQAKAARQLQNTQVKYSAPACQRFQVFTCIKRPAGALLRTA